MRLDPMFSEMEQIFETGGTVKTIIDIGCGYGVPSCWLLEWYPEAKVFGIDPSVGRVRVAAVALGERGEVSRGLAPDIPVVSRPVDLAVMLDMVHYLTDEHLLLTLQRLKEKLRQGGRLVVRAAIPPDRRFPWFWWLENLKLRLSNTPFIYRGPERLQTLIDQAGFCIERILPSGKHQELLWLIGRRVDLGAPSRLTEPC